MARGETSRATAHAKVRAGVVPTDDRFLSVDDAYYRSRDTSVIRRSGIDVRGRPGAPRKVVTYASPAENASAHQKYYAQPKAVSVVPSNVGVPKTARKGNTFFIEDRAQIYSTVQDAIVMVVAGQPVKLVVKDIGTLVFDVTVNLDLMVAREVLTESQRRDITVHSVPQEPQVVSITAPATEPVKPDDAVEGLSTEIAKTLDAVVATETAEGLPDVSPDGTSNTPDVEAGTSTDDSDDLGFETIDNTNGLLTDKPIPVFSPESEFEVKPITGQDNASDPNFTSPAVPITGDNAGQGANLTAPSDNRDRRSRRSGRGAK